MKNLLVKSYGKINLALKVKNIREDNYHNIDTIILPIKLHDSILISELKKAVDHSITMDDFSVLETGDNLVTKALIKFLKSIECNKKFRFDIHKVIPSKAGLGGGSSNAAFTLTGINKFLNANMSKKELIEISNTLGSDVSFFIDCLPSRCQGKGENIQTIRVKNHYYVLLVKPLKGCKTQDVYSKWEEMDSIPSGNIDKVIDALETGNDEMLAEHIFNDLESVAVNMVHEISDIKEQLYNIGFKIVSMTGSGSCVFALSQNKKEIKKAARILEQKYIVITTEVINDVDN